MKLFAEINIKILDGQTETLSGRTIRVHRQKTQSQDCVNFMETVRSRTMSNRRYRQIQEKSDIGRTERKRGLKGVPKKLDVAGANRNLKLSEYYVLGYPSQF